jgi:hypothetical protein
MATVRECLEVVRVGRQVSWQAGRNRSRVRRCDWYDADCVCAAPRCWNRARLTNMSRGGTCLLIHTSRWSDSTCARLSFALLHLFFAAPVRMRSTMLSRTCVCMARVDSAARMRMSTELVITERGTQVCMPCRQPPSVMPCCSQLAGCALIFHLSGIVDRGGRQNCLDARAGSRAPHSRLHSLCDLRP